MRFEACFLGRVLSADGDPLVREEVEAFVDLSVGELEKIGAEDIDVATNVVRGNIRVSVSVVTEDDLLAAQQLGSSQIRTAFHAAGGATPGWSVEWIEAKTHAEDAADGPSQDLVDA